MKLINLTAHFMHYNHFNSFRLLPWKRTDFSKKSFDLLTIAYPNAPLARISINGNLLQSLMNLSASAIRLYYLKQSHPSTLVSELYPIAIYSKHFNNSSQYP